MADLTTIALVAALEREVRPLVKHWSAVEREHDGRRFQFFEGADAVLVCGGIGATAARRATEAVIALYQPAAVKSVGFAGALQPSMRIGDIIIPSRVMDAADHSCVETGEGEGTIVTLSSVASVSQKAKVAAAYGAQAVDMEAAAVARGAQARRIPFTAVKAISDEADFEMPPMERFIDDGQFRTGRFVAYNVVRPLAWPAVIKVARNAKRASNALCDYLGQFLVSLRRESSEMAAVDGQKQS